MPPGMPRGHLSSGTRSGGAIRCWPHDSPDPYDVPSSRPRSAPWSRRAAGSLPFALIHGEAPGGLRGLGAGRGRRHARRPRHASGPALVEAGEPLVLHDALCPMTPASFIAECVRRAVETAWWSRGPTSGVPYSASRCFPPMSSPPRVPRSWPWPSPVPTSTAPRPCWSSTPRCSGCRHPPRVPGSAPDADVRTPDVRTGGRVVRRRGRVAPQTDESPRPVSEPRASRSLGPRALRCWRLQGCGAPAIRAPARAARLRPRSPGAARGRAPRRRRLREMTPPDARARVRRVRASRSTS